MKEVPCAYCDVDVVGKPFLVCAACEVPIHRDCWLEAGHCPAYACGSTTAIDPAVAIYRKPTSGPGGLAATSSSGVEGTQGRATVTGAGASTGSALATGAGTTTPTATGAGPAASAVPGLSRTSSDAVIPSAVRRAQAAGESEGPATGNPLQGGRLWANSDRWPRDGRHPVVSIDFHFSAIGVFPALRRLLERWRAGPAPDAVVPSADAGSPAQELLLIDQELARIRLSRMRRRIALGVWVILYPFLRSFLPFPLVLPVLVGLTALAILPDRGPRGTRSRERALEARRDEISRRLL